MPYIPKQRRDALLDRAQSLGLREAGQSAGAPGELSFLTSQILAGYLAVKGKSFTIYAGVVGMLVLLIFELYKEFIDGYEATKRLDNGGVW